MAFSTSDNDDIFVGIYFHSIAISFIQLSKNVLTLFEKWRTYMIFIYVRWLIFWGASFWLQLSDDTAMIERCDFHWPVSFSLTFFLILSSKFVSIYTGCWKMVIFVPMIFYIAHLVYFYFMKKIDWWKLHSAIIFHCLHAVWI